jgi:hypothetical protein
MPKMTPMRAMGGLVALTLVVGGGNLWASYSQVQASQHRWCSVLVTLDDADMHAPKPTTAFGRNLVDDFHGLRQEFCG